MKITDVAIEDLKEYKNNPRINDDSVPLVAQSIKEFGFKVPIVIDKNNVIVAGHTRIKAAKQLGLTTVPAVIADDLTPAQIKAFRLADNKVGEKTYWNYEMLEEELMNIDTVDMGLLGFDVSDDDEDDDGMTRPDAFKEYDEDIETQHKCPKCGYEW